MKRRNFLKLSATASAMGLLPLELKAMLKSVDLTSCDVSNRKLVLINLAGGNDGLNTIIPINEYDTYANAFRFAVKYYTADGKAIPSIKRLEKAYKGAKDSCYPLKSQPENYWDK